MKVAKPARLKAFTISEMLVVLLITSIVISMVFSVLHLLQVQMNGIAMNYEKNTELTRLRQSLWVDLNTCNSPFFDPTENSLHLSNVLEEKTYLFENDRIISSRDTFNITLKSKEFYYINKVIDKGEIDAITLETTKDRGEKRIFIYRRNTAFNYMNR